MSPLAFRLLARLLPRRFRDRYADDMAACFAERRDDARRSGGAVAVARLWLRTTASLIRSAVAERWRSALDPPPGRTPVPASHRGGLVNHLWQDARFALRPVRRQPLYALFVVATLAVGIGAVTAVFSVVNGVLLRPLPYDHPDELVGVRTYFHPESGFDFPDFPMSPPEYLDYRNHSRALAGVAAFQSGSATLGGPEGEPERVAGAAVTANLFDVLRVRPVAGRTFTAEEDRPQAPAMVILSYGLWQSRFGGDPGVVGRAIPVNGVSRSVVGVMPASFAYPSNATRLWLPLALDEANPGNRKAHSLIGVGRLAAGTTIETARAELGALMAAWRAADAEQYTGHGIQIQPLFEDAVGGVRRALLLLLGATALLLLIVCANVASVVLARGEGRLREMAIRGALGAGRWRLVRLALDTGSLPRAAGVVIDGRVLLAAAGASIASAVVSGLLPALKGSAPDLQAALGADGRTTTTGLGRLWFRRGLVAAEVALRDHAPGTLRVRRPRAGRVGPLRGPGVHGRAPRARDRDSPCARRDAGLAGAPGRHAGHGARCGRPRRRPPGVGLDRPAAGEPALRDVAQRPRDTGRRDRRCHRRGPGSVRRSHAARAGREPDGGAERGVTENQESRIKNQEF